MPSIEFMGESFEVWPKVSFYAMKTFNRIMKQAKNDPDSVDEFEAIEDLLKECLIAEDWGRFQALAQAQHAGIDDLMAVVKDMTEAQAERPTSRSTDSSDGPNTTDLNSELSSEDRALEESGLRPDQKLAVLRTRGAA